MTGGDRLITTTANNAAAPGGIVRSEFYLAEGERLAHIGSWALDPGGFFDYWSRELFYIFGLDETAKAPTLQEYLGLVHPNDREFVERTIETMIKIPRTARMTPNATLKGLKAEPSFCHHRRRLPLSSASLYRLVKVLSSRCRASNSFLSFMDICCPVP